MALTTYGPQTFPATSNSADLTYAETESCVTPIGVDSSKRQLQLLFYISHLENCFLLSRTLGLVNVMLGQS